MYINGVDSDDPAVLFADNWRAPDALRDLFRGRRHRPDRPTGRGAARLYELPSPRLFTATVGAGASHRPLRPPDNGPTDTWNLICLCPHHHRLHHRGKLGITGNADLTLGTRVRSCSPTHEDDVSSRRHQSPGGPPPEPSGTWRHPLGERLQHWAVYFNPPDPRTPTPTDRRIRAR
ncbi:MAG: HNH endonuclease [Ilumatobacteraceae bacterium]